MTRPKCCAAHEWQQCESCAAASLGSANGRNGPTAPITGLPNSAVYERSLGAQSRRSLLAHRSGRIAANFFSAPTRESYLPFRLHQNELFACSPPEICLDRVLAAKQALSMHDACAEALMLRARLAEQDKDLAAARAALAEAHALAASLEWLPLEQRINAEIRRLGAQGGQ